MSSTISVSVFLLQGDKGSGLTIEECAMQSENKERKRQEVFFTIHPRARDRRRDKDGPQGERENKKGRSGERRYETISNSSPALSSFVGDEAPPSLPLS